MCEHALPSAPQLTEPLAAPHAIHSDGSWRCGECYNARGVRDCYSCDAPFVSVVASSAPMHLNCTRCGARNRASGSYCGSCGNALRSKLDTIKHEVADTTSHVARDLGLHVTVRCPGCLKVCVLPSSACFRCGACDVYFAAPSVAAVTGFHVSRLTRSLSSSVSRLFTRPTTFSVAKFFQSDDDDSSSDDDIMYEPMDDDDETDPVRPLTLEEEVPIGIPVAAPTLKVARRPLRPAMPPTLRKTQSAPTTLPPTVSFEKDWDFARTHDDFATDSEDEEETKEELDDASILRSLRQSAYYTKCHVDDDIYHGDTIVLD
ncbi:hypothetical protein SPRG_15100 [Saprolegnia parasitica CBS 223.65]|uniref:RanBP2-type domain-containing protein n=1 Tax=Saprolegnia parasitica (strain CBS 223.65) TaxID=695850 RepID=A0A067BZP0_SAPPC|nr:hypothetical protein SPRG_15100 [Saprolegnia parasitica CBS 223.65]KDO19766.1 hypothetical protein SPRG_15100 [Saprolegnia parasitica CBS 223.65]|eukprot:XP_012209528.1 hypothetical protein SPRG_15100 [Saprolegnia parasitica CBS 223.65]